MLLFDANKSLLDHLSKEIVETKFNKKRDLQAVTQQLMTVMALRHLKSFGLLSRCFPLADLVFAVFICSVFV